MRLRFSAIVLGMAFLVTSARAWSQTAIKTPDPTIQDLFRAVNLTIPAREEELGRDVYKRPWDFSALDKGNFTAFSPQVQRLAVTADGSLGFLSPPGRAVLVWGNGDGKQPLRQRLFLWPGDQTVHLRVRQKADVSSTWTLDFRHDSPPSQWKQLGDTATRNGLKRELRGTDWQTLKFDARVTSFLSRAGIVPDGFVIAVQTPVENAFEIQSLRITRPVYEGYCRKEFDLPQGKVWRAVAEAGYGYRLHVNGREVPLQNSVFQLPRWDGPADYRSNRRSPDGPGTIPVDLSPYLRPGRNCIGMQVKQVGILMHLYLQCRVVMDSGDTVLVDTDRNWQYAAKAPDGWSNPGRVAGDWAPAATSGLGILGYVVSDYLIEGGGYWMGPGFPPYDGRIVLANPGKNEPCLYFDAGRPVATRVRIPAGLANRQPTIAWQLTGYDVKTHEEPVLREGTVDRFEREGDSLLYRLDAGVLSRGAYALGIALRDANGKTIEARPREPLMVIGRVPMREVNGDSYEDGLELALETEIDFTNPGDPHPCVETTVGENGSLQVSRAPRIVRKPGLVYRESSPNSGRAVPTISYSLTLKRPGDYYLMVLEYPNDTDRWSGLAITPANDEWTRAGPSVWTGDRYPLTDKLQELKCLYRAEPGATTVTLVPIQRHSTAAAARLRVYHVRNELPALRVNAPEGGQRRIGVYTERTAAPGGFWRTLGRIPAGGVFATGRFGRNATFRPIPERMNYLANALDACEQFVRYLRFTGQNLHAMGTLQYEPGNTGYSTRPRAWDSRVPRDLRETLIRVLGRNGIDVIANLSYAGHSALQVEYPYNDGQVAIGQDTAILVGRDGAQPAARDAGRGYGSGWNALHPRVRELMLMVASDVAEKYKDQPNFRGVCWTSYLTGEWLPGFGGMNWRRPGVTLFYSYDDATMRQFVADTGIAVPGEPADPQRFARRHDFLTQGDMRERWIAWRCAKVRELFGLLQQRIQAVRPDLNLYQALYFDVGHADQWAESGKPVAQYLREWGYDLTLYRDAKGLWPTRWVNAIFHSAPAGRRPGWAAGIEQIVGREFRDLYAGNSHRAAVIMHQWNEVTFHVPQDADWPRHQYTGRLLTQPNAGNARETFTLTLAGTDPVLLPYAFMDVNMIAGQEQELRPWVRVYRALPDGAFQPALGTSLASNLAIREFRGNQGYYLCVANPGCWSIRGEITAAGADGVEDLAAGRALRTAQRGNETVIPVDLAPYGVAAFRVTGIQPRATGWSNEPIAAADRKHLEGIAARAERLLQDPRAQRAIRDNDAAFLRQSLAEARKELGDGHVAKAWSILTYWRFWHLVKLVMEPAALGK